MNGDEQNRRCKVCGKKLIDEKNICRRYALSGRNVIGSVFGALAGLTIAVGSIASMLNNNSNDNQIDFPDDTNDDPFS